MNKRSPALDVLRCVAVVLVMFRHYRFGAIATQTGWVGVDLFFVLSGFLVSGLLFQEYLKIKKLNGKLFLIRRGLKIYPTFWVVLILNLFYLLYKQQPITAGRILSELFFVQNFFENIIGISWSLAIEEHFYFLLIFLAIIAVKKQWIQKRRIVLSFCAVIFLACLSGRILVNYLKPFNEWTHLFPTYLRIDSLMFGVLISWFYHFEYDRYLTFVKRYKYLIGIFIVTGLAFPFFFPVDSPVMNTIGLSLLYIAFGGILSFTEGNKFFTHKFFRPLAYIGKYSYAIYLVHILVGPAVANFFRVHIFTNPSLEWVNKSIYLLSNIACGVVVSLVVEQPFLKLRERYFPKPVSKPPLHSSENLPVKTRLAVE